MRGPAERAQSGEATTTSFPYRKQNQNQFLCVTFFGQWLLSFWKLELKPVEFDDEKLHRQMLKDTWRLTWKNDLEENLVEELEIFPARGMKFPSLIPSLRPFS